ncbi:MAG: SAM-dependent methyltransferase [Hyphomonadaceae bacterium]
MIEQQPSRTAVAAAALRAAHQVLEGGKIFADPLAMQILGLDADTVRREISDPLRRGIRLFIAARTRFAETKLAEAIAQRGVSQLVVLGAGLDTFAYRSPLASKLTMFEVDFPATQAWKKRRLEETGITPPANLVYAPVNFETDDLVGQLEAAGFDPAKRSYFLWLGVVPYLTRKAIMATLGAVGALPGGTEIAFDYSNPILEGQMTEEERAARNAMVARVASVGEPFLSFFETAELHAELAARGLGAITDFGPGEIIEVLTLPFVPPANPLAAQNIPARGGHLLHAATG